MNITASKPGAKQAAGGADIVKDTSSASFAKDVIEASMNSLVLVDFWAQWCAPCKQLGPLIEKVVLSYGGKVRLVRLDTDAHPAIASQLRVQSLPTVYAFRDGRPLDGFVGVQSESMLRQFIDRLLAADGAADAAAVLEAAGEALEKGDLQGAAAAYASILQEDQQNADALAGLALCYLRSGDIARAEQTIGLVPPDKHGAASVQGVLSALELARLAAAAPSDHGDLEARVATNPADHQARLDLAMALAARGAKAEALDHLLTIVRRDRSWNEEAARKQLVKLFEAWGPKDEHTIEGRKRLSSILFS